MEPNYRVPKYFEERATEVEYCSLLHKGTDTTVIWVN